MTPPDSDGPMNRCLLVSLAALFLCAALQPALRAAENASPGDRPCWHSAPTLSVMTGFIYEPLSSYPIEKWLKDLGSRFDAEQWVADFREVGASHVVFYDKWIDGLVFHDTKTTNFKTRRDFLGELAAACQRGGLPLVIYFNAVSDGNLEFDEWSLLDKEGKPIVFGARWPTRYQTLHSPFREKCVEQVRELLSHYGPIHGIWHDIFHERFNTTSPWTAQGYERMFGEPFESATPARLEQFQARTLAGYLDEIDRIRREQHQDQCVYTANGSGSSFLAGGLWRSYVGLRLQYLFNEGHSFSNNEQLARMAWALPKPLDINLLMNKSWFAPLEDVPPPPSFTVQQAIAATAIAVCQGAGVNFALTPGHDGRFGEDLERAKAVGAWFRTIAPWLSGAEPAADVGIVCGPEANTVTEMLARAGVATRWIASDGPLPECRLIVVPPRTPIDSRLRDYIEAGGTLVALGDVGPAAEMFGATLAGDVGFAAELQGAAIQVDSEYNAQFAAANALDDDSRTAWASGGAPMPHWAEITMPEPFPVAAVEVESREGPYRVTDIDIEVPEGGGWRVVKSIRGATQPTIAARLDPPVETARVRVRILRETFEGSDRQYADVASIRVLDAAGVNRALSVSKPVRLSGAIQGSLRPSAVAAVPTTAAVLAQFDHGQKPPAVLRNRLARGQAILVTAREVPDDVAVWDSLRSVTLGGPDFTVKASDPARFRVILTRVGDARVAHVIDSAVPAVNYEPEAVEVSLQAPSGLATRTTLNGDRDTISVAMNNGRVSFTVRPDPVATVILTAAQ